MKLKLHKRIYASWSHLRNWSHNLIEKSWEKWRSTHKHAFNLSFWARSHLIKIMCGRIFDLGLYFHLYGEILVYPSHHGCACDKGTQACVKIHGSTLCMSYATRSHEPSSSLCLALSHSTRLNFLDHYTLFASIKAC